MWDDYLFGDGDLSPRAKRIRYWVVSFIFTGLIVWATWPISTPRFMWLCLLIAIERRLLPHDDA